VTSLNVIGWTSFDEYGFSYASSYEDHIGLAQAKGFGVVAALLGFQVLLVWVIIYLFLSEEEGDGPLKEEIRSKNQEEGLTGS
jgi:hypothetical protein